jgi:CRP-like cAMP-binding protein
MTIHARPDTQKARPRRGHPGTAISKSAAFRKAANPASVVGSLLASLPHADYRRLLAAGLEPVSLEFGEILHEPGEPIEHVYFPVDGVIALLVTAAGHKALKVGLIGCEGMVGIPLALGIPTTYCRALVQGAGTAMRMDAASFGRQLSRSKALRQALFLYKHALVAQIERSAVCKQVHSFQQRLARFLLMTSDRAGTTEIKMTQEFMANILGVRRTSLTIEACALRKRSLIGYSRGRITILDRKGLNAVSCECYRIINRIHARAYAHD